MELGPSQLLVIELFGVGPATSPTNNQDLITTIVSVVDGTNVTISQPAGVTATDVTSFVGIPAALVAVAALAIFIPARRAMKIDPIVALRYG